MAGENPANDSLYAQQSNSDPDYDGSGSGGSPELPYVDVSELLSLLEGLDNNAGRGYNGADGREDWALERECEISRLERENDELRKMLGIDPQSIAASDVDMDAEIARMEAPRHPLLSGNRGMSSGHSHQGSGDRWDVRPSPSYWEGNGNGGGNGQQQQSYQQPQPSPPPMQQQQQQSGGPGGAPLQRMDLANGMRIMQGRRPGIFGAGQQRGAMVGGTGRGVSSVAMPPVAAGLGPWGNSPSSPAPPLMSDRVVPNPWQAGASVDR